MKKPNKWYSKGLGFTCIQCGRCCTGEPGYVWFESEEASGMAETLGIEVEKFMITYTRYTKGEYSLKEHSNGDCVFLEHDPEGCRIYKSRPAQCRTFPFWQSIMCRETVWDTTARKCPGMDNGILFTEKDIEKRILQNG